MQKDNGKCESILFHCSINFRYHQPLLSCHCVTVFRCHQCLDRSCEYGWGSAGVVYDGHFPLSQGYIDNVKTQSPWLQLWHLQQWDSWLHPAVLWPEVQAHGIVTIFSHRSLVQIKLCTLSIFPLENLILCTSKSCSTELLSPWNLIYVASMTQLETSEHHPCTEVGPMAQSTAWFGCLSHRCYIFTELCLVFNGRIVQDLTYAIETQHCGWAMPCKL